MNIKIKKLTDSAIIPTKSTAGSVAYDIAIPNTIYVPSGRSVVKLNFAIEMPIGYEAKIEPRSGHASKGMMGFVNADIHFDSDRDGYYDCDVIVGKIDPDYRGEVGVIINNHDQPFWLPRGFRIGQMTIYRVEAPAFIEVDELNETSRGAGGFGHTGV